MIRDLEKSDVPACIEIVRSNWDDCVANRFSVEIDQAFNARTHQPHYFVCDLHGQIQGFIGVMPSWIMYNFWDVVWVNTHHDHQNSGVATTLIWFALHEIRRKRGAAVQLVTKQEDFFKKFGFRKVHTYSDVWKLMVKQLTPVDLTDGLH